MITGIVSLRLFGFLIPLLVAVVLGGYLVARSGKKRRQRPGMHMQYRCPGRTAAESRDILSHKNIHDIFAYTLEPSPQGGQYLLLHEHLPTQQQLQTVFLLVFTAECPAAFTLTFVREAFGMREPVVPEALLDEFFQTKLGAERAETPYS